MSHWNSASCNALTSLFDVKSDSIKSTECWYRALPLLYLVRCVLYICADPGEPDISVPEAPDGGLLYPRVLDRDSHIGVLYQLLHLRICEWGGDLYTTVQ